MPTITVSHSITATAVMVVAIGSYQKKYGVTLSLPSRLGRDGLAEVLMPTLADDEARALDESAATLRRALESIEASDGRSGASAGLDAEH